MPRGKRGRKPLNTSFKRKLAVPPPNVYHGELLPSCAGPKFHPFRTSNPEIQFQTLLNEPNLSDTGGQGYVFKALVDSEPFAIKLFKFFDIEEEKARFADSQKAKMTDDELEGNTDPFFAECRAYGRIEEFYENCQGKKNPGLIAAPCYGYLYISEEQEMDLGRQFGILDWNRLDTHANTRIRALVKQFIPDEPINRKVKSVKRMLSDLKTLHRIGVYPRDTFARNYRGGLIVDFGIALTEPSCVLRVLPEWMREPEKYKDLGAFDDMIRELGIKTAVRAARPENPQIHTRGDYVRGELREEFVELDRSGKNAKPALV
ncbi:hypothetical protein K469DRAFT_756642 [Zopfia rhizophila CBS 207.26]|uniref:Protein kinase domain-containing protein n=1 Tax=Zopfia rhizophila CBS 207.26 TaxID=1314779 RepID=A0A6A6D5N8_9PEZI|nr:hypothetical protein K469DRAFT_756642 [Zopfia rhizophila CBS 207.26]